MKKHAIFLVLIVPVIIFIILYANREVEVSKSAQHYLTKGGLQKGIRLKRAELTKDQENSHLRFELGLMLVYGAFENMYKKNA